jgi:excisionase family DNA binding protein
MRLLTPEEVAERWRLKTARTVREMVRTRRLPGLHVGRVIRLREEDVIRLEQGGLVAEAQKQEAETEAR